MLEEAGAALEFVRFCAHCGESIQDPRNLVNQYSDAARSICFWWCHTCGAKGEVIAVERIIAPELVEGVPAGE